MVQLAAISGSSLAETLIVALFTALIGSLLLWFVGHQLTYRWEDRKRLRESDLAALASFYHLYGEFFATWKLWDSHKRHAVQAGTNTDVQWALLLRAEAAEGGFEALLVKLASERDLSPKDREMLGSFREAYQMLREKIRSNEGLAWWASPGRSDVGYAQYRAYKALAEYLALRLESPRKDRAKPKEPEAIKALLHITDPQRYRGRWWKIAEKTLGPFDGGNAPSGSNAH